MKIQLKNIQKTFGKNQVLQGVDLTCESGSCIGILGANGSGKSTLLSILAGVQQKDRGNFLCDGKDLFEESSRRAHLVGYVPQGTPLMEELTAKDNLRLWYDKEEMDKELENGVLKMLGIPAFLNVAVHKMSGGMKKRLSIGCAMAKHPPVLLFDEPMAALDLSCKETIGNWLRSYKEQGGILLLTTHDAMELELCDSWYILKDGVLQSFAYTGDIHKLVEKL